MHPGRTNRPQGEQGIHHCIPTVQIVHKENKVSISMAIANYILRTTASCFYIKSKLTELIKTSQLWQAVWPVQQRYQMCLVCAGNRFPVIRDTTARIMPDLVFRKRARVATLPMQCFWQKPQAARLMLNWLQQVDLDSNPVGAHIP